MISVEVWRWGFNHKALRWVKTLQPTLECAIVGECECGTWQALCKNENLELATLKPAMEEGFGERRERKQLYLRIGNGIGDCKLAAADLAREASGRVGQLQQECHCSSASSLHQSIFVLPELCHCHCHHRYSSGIRHKDQPQTFAFFLSQSATKMSVGSIKMTLQSHSIKMSERMVCFLFSIVGCCRFNHWRTIAVQWHDWEA